MNLIDATVISVDSKPKLIHDYWFVHCTVISYGHESNTQGVFKDKDKADAFKVGDIIRV